MTRLRAAEAPPLARPLPEDEEEEDAASATWTLVSPKQVRSLIIRLSRATFDEHLARNATRCGGARSRRRNGFAMDGLTSERTNAMQERARRGVADGAVVADKAARDDGKADTDRAKLQQGQSRARRGRSGRAQRDAVAVAKQAEWLAAAGARSSRQERAMAIGRVTGACADRRGRGEE